MDLKEIKINTKEGPKLLIKNFNTELFTIDVQPGETMISALIYIKRGETKELEKVMIERYNYNVDGHYFKKLTMLLERIEKFLGWELIDRTKEIAA